MSSNTTSTSTTTSAMIKLPSRCPDSFFDDAFFNTKWDEFNSYIYDPTQFVRIFHQMIKNKQFDQLKRLRVLIQNQTISICRKQSYAYMRCRTVGEGMTSSQESEVNEDKRSDTIELNPIDEEEREYEIISLRKDLLESASIQSKFYKNESLVVSNNGNASESSLTKVMVFNGDCLDVAFYIQDELIKEGKFPQERVAVLNMANPNTPGGGYKGGMYYVTK